MKQRTPPALRPWDPRPLQEDVDAIDMEDPLAIESRYEALISIVVKHFYPKFQDNGSFIDLGRGITVGIACDDTDYMVRHHLRGLALFVDDGVGTARYYPVTGDQRPMNLKNILKKMEKSIVRRDRVEYAKAERMMTRTQHYWLSEIEYEVLGEYGKDLSEVLRNVIGPQPYHLIDPNNVEADEKFWTSRLSVIRVALLRASKRGAKPKSEIYLALREIISLWELLSNEHAKQPTTYIRKKGTQQAESDRRVSAKWMDFVLDAAEIYADVGLLGAASKSSKSTWAAILKGGI